MFFGDIQQFDEMYNKIEFINKKTEVILQHIETIAKQTRDTDENTERLSDTANRLTNEEENQALKERIGELEKENEWLEKRLKISREISNNLIEILIKGD